MKVRKNISLEDNILELGIKNANKLGLSFSAYITMLINKDTNVDVVSIKNEIEVKEEVKEELLNSIDDILNI